ncbi:MAG: DUF2167 domain-containing protein [Opitutaceae bacterium]|nr:DUF2167 domain-containing protein [Opitutaceae bacterium]
MKLRTVLLTLSVVLTHPFLALAEDSSKAATRAPVEEQPAADQAAPDFTQIPDIDWIHGPTRATLGDQAAIAIPEGYVFTGKAGTQRMIQLFGNIVADDEMGFLAAKGKSWFVVFKYDDSGYVKDDEKDAIDADALLKSYQAGAAQDNKRRKEQGLDTLDIVGWETPPAYNPATHNLEWATRLRSGDGSISINHNIRLLGREGVMKVIVVGDPTELAEASSATRQMLVAGYEFNKGKTYAEFKKGDKIAEYGLMGLMAAGAGAVAVKSGLLAKFWKVLIVPIVAVGAWLKKLFKRNDTSTPA